MEDTKITLIIPIYNVEPYLRTCVDSVLAQTYTNLEIFLVDDGSPDRSGEICDEYARSDARIRVIHKENGGLSDARNVAMDAATGTYITFIDSDDWVSASYIENLYGAISRDDAELAISGFENAFTLGKTRPADNHLQGYYCLTPIECLRRLLYQDGIDTMAWGKLYRRELFDSLRFPVPADEESGTERSVPLFVCQIWLFMDRYMDSVHAIRYAGSTSTSPVSM